MKSASMCALTAALCAIAASEALCEDCRIAVEPVFDSPDPYSVSVAAGRILPLRVKLTSSGDVTGRITASIKGRERIESVHPLSVGAGTFEYEILLGFPHTTGSFRMMEDLEAVVKVEIAGKEVKEAVFRMDQREARYAEGFLLPVIVAWVGEKGGIPAALLRTGIRRPFASVCATLENMPSDWRSYFAVDAVVMGEADWSTLRPEKAMALAEWVKAGGRAVVHAGTVRRGREGLPLSAFVADTDPGEHVVRVESLPPGFECSEGSRGSMRFRRIRLRSGAEASLEGEIFAAVPFGIGAVCACAADLESESMSDLRDSRRAFLSAVNGGEIPEGTGLGGELGVKYGIYERGDNEAPPWAMALEGIVAVGTVPPAAMLVFALVFILAAGPADYLVLSRLGLLRYTWITTLAAAAVFSLAAHVAMRELRGSESLGYMVAVDDADESGAVRRAWYGVFVPGSSASRRAEAAGDGVVFDVGLLSVRSSFRAGFLDDSRSCVFTAPAWSGVALAGIAYRPAGSSPPPDARLSLRNGVLNGSVSFRGARPVAAALVHRDAAYAAEVDGDGLVSFDGVSEAEGADPWETASRILESCVEEWRDGDFSGEDGDLTPVNSSLRYVRREGIPYFRAFTGPLYVPRRISGGGWGILVTAYRDDADLPVDDAEARRRTVRLERRTVAVKEGP